VSEWKPLEGMDRHILSVRNGGPQMFADYRKVYNTARVEGMEGPNAAPALKVGHLAHLAALALALAKFC